MSFKQLLNFSWLASWKWAQQRGLTASAASVRINQPIMSAEDVLALGTELEGLAAIYPINPKQSEALRQGEQSSRFMGSGMEYEESRPYEEGDEIRRINWKLMAKTGNAYTKLYQEERQESWFILLDHRQSMRFGTRERLKATQASRIAGYYAWMAQQAGIPISIGRLTGIFEQSPIFEGRSSFSQIMQVASQACIPGEQGQASNSGETRLNDVLFKVSHQLPSGSRLILLSDFHDVDAETQEILTALQTSLLVKAVLVYDKSEEQLPNVAGMQLQSTLNNKLYQLNREQQLYFAASATEYFTNLANYFQASNAQFYKVRTDNDLMNINLTLQTPVLSKNREANSVARIVKPA